MKMWIWSLSLLSLCGGILGNNEAFCRRGENQCYRNGMLPRVPASDDDLTEFCPIVLNRLNCLQDVETKCGVEMALKSEERNKIVAYISDVCKEGSKFRADVVKELPCIKGVIENRGIECSNLTNYAMTDYEKRTGGYDEDNQDIEYHKPRNCFFLLHTSACLFAELDRDCGAGAKAVALDAFNRMPYYDRVCSTKVYDDLLELIPVMEMEIDMRAIVRDIILLNKEA